MRHATYLGGNGYKDMGGKLFRKQILRKGVWIHPNNPSRRMEITEATLSALVENFKRGVVSKVAVPWTHTDDASKNTGYVVGLEMTDDGLDAIIEFTDDTAAAKAERGEIPGVSCGLDFDYEVKDMSAPDGGKRIGPTLLHVALVNHPYVKGMRDFEPILLSEGGDVEPLIMLTEEVKEMTLEELIAALKEHGIDVEALKAEAAKVPDLEAKAADLEAKAADLEAKVSELTAKADLSEQISALLGTVVNLSEGGLVQAVQGLIDENKALKQEKLETEANQAVAALLSEGKITKAQEDGFKKLYLSDKAMFEAIASTMPKIVDLSEYGQQSHSDTTDIESEIERLTAEYRQK